MLGCYRIIYVESVWKTLLFCFLYTKIFCIIVILKIYSYLMHSDSKYKKITLHKDVL